MKRKKVNEVKEEIKRTVSKAKAVKAIKSKNEKIYGMAVGTRKDNKLVFNRQQGLKRESLGTLVNNILRNDNVSEIIITIKKPKMRIA